METLFANEARTALLAAVEPVAAYVARTPAGNAHADRCAALVNAVADYVELASAPPVAAGPDWERVTARIMAHWDMDTPITPLMARTRAHLDLLHARAARPLVERMSQARITSHHLGTPDFF